MVKEIVWTSALGKRTKVSELTHQHLSNIIWWNEIFHDATYNIKSGFFKIQEMLLLELEQRFNNERLNWKPLPVPDEIKYLRDMGLIMNNGDIIGNKNTKLDGKIIGNINHTIFL
jgi:hypothetical protein